MVAGQHHYRCATTPHRLQSYIINAVQKFLAKMLDYVVMRRKCFFFLALFKIFLKISGVFRLKTHFFPMNQTNILIILFNLFFSCRLVHQLWYKVFLNDCCELLKFSELSFLRLSYILRNVSYLRRCLPVCHRS